MATQILATQSKRLQELRNQNYFDDFRHMEFHQLMVSFYADQGKSERIKNFPYPRQFATLNHFFMWIFVLLLPLALIPQFAEIGQDFSEQSPLVGDIFVWLSIPFYVIVIKSKRIILI